MMGEEHSGDDIIDNFGLPILPRFPLSTKLSQCTQAQEVVS